MTEEPNPTHRDRPALSRILPFAIFIVLLAAEPWLEPFVAPWLDPRWLYGIRAGVTALALVALLPRFREILGQRSVGGTPWIVAVVVGVGVFGLWILLDFPPFVLGRGDGFDPRVGGRIHPGLAASRLAGAALVVPVMEELFWRSFLMRWIHRSRFLDVDPRQVGWKALVVTSVLFATEHRLWLAGLLAGLAYGELYRRTEDLRVVILSHAVTNGVLGFWVLATGSWSFW